MAGSDDGNIFFWDRKSTNIVKILKGDKSIVNCLQPHPDCCFLASSGIDHVVRLWTPQPEVNRECVGQVSQESAESFAFFIAMFENAF